MCAFLMLSGWVSLQGAEVPVPLDGFLAYTPGRVEGTKLPDAAIVKNGTTTALHLDESRRMVQQFVPISPGAKSIKFSVKVRPGNETTTRFEIILTAADATKNYINRDGKPSSLGAIREGVDHLVGKFTRKTWEKFEMAGPFPANASYLVITLFALDKGQVEFSDFDVATRATASR